MTYETQVKLWQWGAETFADVYPGWGRAEERSRRFAEEACEVLAANGMSREEMHRLVDWSWDKDSGEIGQECAQALITLLMLAHQRGVVVGDQLEIELARLREPGVRQRIRDKLVLKQRAGMAGTGEDGQLDPAEGVALDHWHCPEGCPQPRSEIDIYCETCGAELKQCTLETCPNVRVEMREGVPVVIDGGS